MNFKDVFDKYGVSKESCHHYSSFYDTHIGHLKESHIKLLEIGVDTGVSLLAWRDYFVNAIIYGIDIQTPMKISSDPRIRINVCDQGNEEMLGKYFKSVGNFDVIIDDGGHMMQQQQLSLKLGWKYLNSGGIYVIEDLHTSFMNFYKSSTETTTYKLMKYIETLLDIKSFSIDPLYTTHISENELVEMLKTMEYCKIEKSDTIDPFDYIQDNSPISFCKKKL